jgi:hypothetical protein
MSSTTTKEKIMSKTLVGERIKLVRSSDPYTRLRRGDLGTVTREPYDNAGSMCIGVDWDNGSSLSLVEGEDSWVSVGIAEEWLTAFDQYLSAGYKLLDLWQQLDLRDSLFLNNINMIEFPFAMSFDEYLAEMASIKRHLDEAGDK